MMPLLVWVVGRPVAFDYELRITTIEICHIPTKLMLAAEFESEELPIAKK